MNPFFYPNNILSEEMYWHLLQKHKFLGQEWADFISAPSHPNCFVQLSRHVSCTDEWALRKI